MKHLNTLLFIVLLLAQCLSFANAQEDVDTSFLGDTALLFQASEHRISPSRVYDYAVQLMTADGITTLVERDTSSDQCGDIAPDGRQFAFSSTRDHNGSSEGSAHSEIYIADSDGTGARRLTFNEDREFSPRWSPDGTRILFSGMSNTADNNTIEIYMMDGDGDNFEQLTDNDSADRNPTWSPDGTRILFNSNRDGDYELYTMSPDGSDVQQLTNNDRDDGRAAYSPDGAFIAFNAFAGDEADDLYVMTADGVVEQRITNTPEVREYGVVWSPDGTMLAYTVLPALDAATEVWLLNSDGTSEPLLADAATDYVVCDWDTVSGS